MADTALQVVLSPFLGVLFGNVNDFIQSEIAQTWRVEIQMQKLSRTLSTIKDVLDGANERQFTDHALQNWLGDVKDVMYEADDLLDECAFESLQYVSKREKGKTMVVDFVKQIKFHREIGKRIKELTERFDEIAERRFKFHLQKENSIERRVEIHQDRVTSSMLSEQPLGRDEDKENIVNLLLNNVDNQDNVSICPLIGISGLGKTTLAQMVYNEERIRRHFMVRVWHCVSGEFDLRKLTKSIIVSLSGIVSEFEELDHLQRLLEEKLSGKRFLLVLDDVWNDDQERWIKLKSSLNCGAKGSSVIVTSRLQTVASITSTVSAYNLTALSESDCWSLFKQRAFGSGNEERPELVEIGKEIVRKCGGVPLAAKALGGLMRFKNEENGWLFVRDTEIWKLPQSSENNILPALRLSYDHLPSHLKQCFAYCSLFPKNCKIGKKNLIRLWMANGLIQLKGVMELEDAGNEIFNALLWRSFFQDIEKDENGSVKSCKMHGLVHDLACHIASDECAVIDVGKGKNIAKRTRHLSVDLSILPSSSHQVDSVLKSSACLRSFIMSGFPLTKPQFIFSHLKRLRALDLSHTSATELPNTIGKMIHLRYLDLSFTRIASLPKSICKLRNLQTLYLNECSELKRLPKDMRKLCSLRHLEIWGCVKLAEMPFGIGQLSCLQTLTFFIVGLKTGCNIKELKGLNLGGELWLRGLENVKNPIEAKETLIAKQNLRVLSLSWSDSDMQENSSEVMKGLQPHSNVRQLFIQGYTGVTFPSWFTSLTLPKLTKICLSGCKRCERLPQLGRLPLLKVLIIFSMDSVRFIEDEHHGEILNSRFPALEELRLNSMPNLEGWSLTQASEATLFPCLEKLTLKRCPKMTRLSLLRKLRLLKFLKISRMNSVNEIFRNSLVEGFSSLEELKLSRVCNLEGSSSSQGVEGALFLSLKSITLKGCSNSPGFSLLPSLQKLPRLSSLEILKFDELTHFPGGLLGDSTSLQTLVIYECPGMNSLTRELMKLKTLKSLSIHNCHALNHFPQLEMTSLEHLSIFGCERLTAPVGGLRHLPAIRELDIIGCPEFKVSTEDFHNLFFLQSLKLSGLPKLTCFPDGINGAKLQCLYIQKCCSDLMDLPNWIGNLTSLQVLRFHGCKNRKALPEGIQKLSALRVLTIEGCDPDLEKRCVKTDGEDWDKISHIPYVIITSEVNSSNLMRRCTRTAYGASASSVSESWLIGE